MSDQSYPKPPTPPRHQPERWRELAEKATKESDPSKLTDLIRQLCEELDEREARLGPRKPSQSDDPRRPLDTSKPHA